MTQKRKRNAMIIGWIAIASSVLVLLYVASLVDDWGRDWTQNQASLDPEHEDQTLRPLTLPASKTEVTNHIRQWAHADARWRCVDVKELDDHVDIHLTRTTGLMRYVDDINVRITPVEDGCRVDAESRSRIGVGDLGQNPRNLKELVASLRKLGI